MIHSVKSWALALRKEPGDPRKSGGERSILRCGQGSCRGVRPTEFEPCDGKERIREKGTATGSLEKAQAAILARVTGGRGERG